MHPVANGAGSYAELGRDLIAGLPSSLEARRFLDAVGDAVPRTEARERGAAPRKLTGMRRIGCAVAPEAEESLVAAAEAAGVPVVRLGVTGGSAVVVEGVFDVPLDEAREAFEGTLPRIFG